MTLVTCSLDSGAMNGNAPLCSAPATHVVTSRNGSYGPYRDPVCTAHLPTMLARVYPGHIHTELINN